MQNERVEIAGLRVDPELYRFISKELLPGTGITTGHFWQSFSSIVEDLAPQYALLLQRRDDLQRQLDDWYYERKGVHVSPNEQREFLLRIGYLLEEGEGFSVATENVDPEIASVAGPQLVVPVSNARYALNAANARLGSLFDALYGTDVIPCILDTDAGSQYNPVRGERVIAQAMEFLNEHLPLTVGSYIEVHDFVLLDTELGKQLTAILLDGRIAKLVDPIQFIGYQCDGSALSSILFRHNSLHVVIQLDKVSAIGKQHPAGIRDVILEAALTTIQDCEDSVSAVDAEDKVNIYRNWLGLMKGDLTACFEKSGRQVIRALNDDMIFQGLDGNPVMLKGRSLLLARNVGIHMDTDTVLTADDREIPEGFLDAMVTCAAALHDLQGSGKLRNSSCGSIYIVKPKLHGPEEVAATVELFGRVEEALGLKPYTIKLGIMDEERRTTLNLKECIRAARNRVVFINTGFLDRTGDEIHTAMQVGPQIPKQEIKKSSWLLAYEDWNVDVGLEVSLPGKGQIGKGMWTAPDRMAAMVSAKIDHPRAGASCAWIPSPTAATLHAMHYHQVCVADQQSALCARSRGSIELLLTSSLLGDRSLTAEEIQAELDNNIQSILGYVVHWIESGIGCSKVADINDVGLMEDRATLRISSQHVCNWLLHGVTNETQVRETFTRMAAVVDQQNCETVGYRPMGPHFASSLAYQAALELVFSGVTQPSGYTESTLTKYRRLAKRRDALSCLTNDPELATNIRWPIFLLKEI